MDRDSWINAMTQFSSIYCASPINNQIVFFNGHNDYFDYQALTQMQSKDIHPSILKAGDSVNNQPNDNGPNSKLKSLYKFSKAKWMLNYGTTRFQPHHMNSVLIETWEAFMLSAGNFPPSRLVLEKSVPYDVTR